MKFIWAIMVFSYMYFIYYLSSLSSPPIMGLVIPFEDKFLHMIEYIPLGFLWYKLLVSLKLKYAINFTYLICFIYAIFDELHQYYVPLRMSDPLDIFFDIIGILLGLKLALLIKWQPLKSLRQ